MQCRRLQASELSERNIVSSISRMLFYSPSIYGWSQMSSEMQALCRETVFHNVRKHQVLFIDGIPMHTTDVELDVTSVLAWILQHRHIFPADFKMLLALKSNEYGIHRPEVSFTHRRGKWTMLSHAQMREALIPDQPPRNPHMAAYIEQLDGLGVGKPGYVRHQQKGQHLLYDRVTRLSTDSYVVFSDIHPGIIAQRPDVAALLRAKLTGRALPAAMQKMLHETCAAEYDVVRTDNEIAALPVDVFTDAELEALNISTPNTQQTKKKKKKNERPAQVTSIRKGSQKTVFVKPHKTPVVRMTLGQALGMLAVDGEADYHNICPQRTSRTLAGSYRPVLQCTKSMRTAGCRERRDRALACAILRQRKQLDVSDYNMAHQVPISLAYALASGCARQVASSASASDQNRRLDDWLPLKTAVVLPQHQQFLPKSLRSNALQ